MKERPYKIETPKYHPSEKFSFKVIRSNKAECWMDNGRELIYLREISL